MTTLDKKWLKTAPQFDVNRWSDFPEVNPLVHDLFIQIRDLRAGRSKPERIRLAAKVKKHIKVCVMDLWAAHKLSSHPYRGISLNKSDYAKGTRYRKIHLKYNYLAGVVHDLVELGYVALEPGVRYKVGPRSGWRTRIKATDSLIALFASPRYGVAKAVATKGLVSVVTRLKVDPDSGASIEPETIILRDKDEDSKLNKNVDYVDTPEIVRMRCNLARINSKIAATRLKLRITNDQFDELEERLSSPKSPSRRIIDFTNNSLCRIFNNSSFDDGGRFYGGWWQELPREFRKYIQIEYKHTVELDYTGHHIRILYAQAGVTPPDDPYDLSKDDFSREDQKQAILIILNASNRKAAIQAMKKSGIKNPATLATAMEKRHSSISGHFHTGVGIRLQRIDSDVAEEVMLRMLDRYDAVVLPVHDSFIVNASRKEELQEVMDCVFSDKFKKEARIDPKLTVLDHDHDEKMDSKPIFVDSECLALLKDYSRYYDIFGH